MEVAAENPKMCMVHDEALQIFQKIVNMIYQISSKLEGHVKSSPNTRHTEALHLFTSEKDLADAVTTKDYEGGFYRRIVSLLMIEHKSGKDFYKIVWELIEELFNERQIHFVKERSNNF